MILVSWFADTGIGTSDPERIRGFSARARGIHHAVHPPALIRRRNGSPRPERQRNTRGVGPQFDYRSASSGGKRVEKAFDKVGGLWSDRAHVRTPQATSDCSTPGARQPKPARSEPDARPASCGFAPCPSYQDGSGCGLVSETRYLEKPATKVRVFF